MQDIIATYLFQHKHCPLPTIGQLQLKQQPAQVIAGEQKIIAPIQEITFEETESPADHLIQYLADELNISAEAATFQLKEYCKKIKFMRANEKVPLPEAGSFSVNAEGHLTFTPYSTNAVFLPAVKAVRIIRQNEEHAILVGDTETTNAVMTEFYTDETPATKSRWWIAAIILALVAATIILIYFNDAAHSASAGNANKITPAAAGETYQSH